jgi:hypothetical protein
LDTEIHAKCTKKDAIFNITKARTDLPVQTLHDIPGCENISMGEGNGCVDIDKMEDGYEILDDDAIVQNVTAMADGETDEEAEKPALMEAHT